MFNTSYIVIFAIAQFLKSAIVLLNRRYFQRIWNYVFDLFLFFLFVYTLALSCTFFFPSAAALCGFLSHNIALLLQEVILLCIIVLTVAVILFRNPMYSLLALIGVFAFAAVTFIINGAEAFGYIFLIVYVGAVAILFLFVTMLLRITGRTGMPTFALRRFVFLNFIPLSCWLYTLYTPSLFRFFENTPFRKSSVTFSEKILYYVNYTAYDIFGFISLYIEHAATFLIITLVLLTAMIGAIVLAMATVDEAV